jgi:hypothetical protein
MSVGPIELVVFVALVILALGAHIIIALLARDKEKVRVRRGFFVYGIPVCFAIAAILSPPDSLSMLVVALPCSLVYGAVTFIWILRRTQTHLE